MLNIKVFCVLICAILPMVNSYHLIRPAKLLQPERDNRCGLTQLNDVPSRMIGEQASSRDDFPW